MDIDCECGSEVTVEDSGRLFTVLDLVCHGPILDLTHVFNLMSVRIFCNWFSFRTLFVFIVVFITPNKGATNSEAVVTVHGLQPCPFLSLDCFFFFPKITAIFIFLVILGGSTVLSTRLNFVGPAAFSASRNLTLKTFQV